MNIEGKVWGKTQPLLLSSAVEIHEINVDKGGFCSTHAHQSKVNAFYVVSGWLTIKRHKSYELIDETELFSGDMCVVPAGEKHSFQACEDTQALEIYWTELNHNDIIRDNVGGMV
jgi:mannose-6-phosphate isomerase-like protein (cupin superfamily)